ncbi:uncharacterized protein DS421_10g305930 [Arachis hypogaea]|nr:uncharacterized protein DS421_10g305930 [Arachis hypogaea]
MTQRHGSWWSNCLVPSLRWFHSRGAEEGVVLVEAYMVAGLCPLYATYRRSGETLIVCEVLQLVTGRSVPDDGQFKQPGPSLVAVTASELCEVLWVVLGLDGACIDIPFAVLCSTLRYDRHRWLHSAVDILDIPEIFSVVST